MYLMLISDIKNVKVCKLTIVRLLMCACVCAYVHACVSYTSYIVRVCKCNVADRCRRVGK